MTKPSDKKLAQIINRVFNSTKSISASADLDKSTHATISNVNGHVSINITTKTALGNVVLGVSGSVRNIKGIQGFAIDHAKISGTMAESHPSGKPQEVGTMTLGAALPPPEKGRPQEAVGMSVQNTTSLSYFILGKTFEAGKMYPILP